MRSLRRRPSGYRLSVVRQLHRAGAPAAPSRSRCSRGTSGSGSTRPTPCAAASSRRPARSRASRRSPGRYVSANAVASPISRASSTHASTMRAPRPRPCMSSRTASDLISPRSSQRMCSPPQATTRPAVVADDVEVAQVLVDLGHRARQHLALARERVHEIADRLRIGDRGADRCVRLSVSRLSGIDNAGRVARSQSYRTAMLAATVYSLSQFSRRPTRVKKSPGGPSRRKRAVCSLVRTRTTSPPARSHVRLAVDADDRALAGGDRRSRRASLPAGRRCSPAPGAAPPA